MRRLKEWRDRALARSKELLAAAMQAAPSFAAEITLAVALVFGTIALWPDFGLRALGLPSAVLLWMAVPQRPTFIDKAPRAVDDAKGKR